MSKFRIGDKVRIVDEWQGNLHNECGKMDKWLGKVMTVREVNGSFYRMEEDRDEWLGRGWYWFDEMIVACNQKIIITTDGNITLARLYEGRKVIRSAEAQCHPNDAFDFATGARLAFERLMDVDKPAKPAKKAVQEPIKLYCVRDDAPGEWLTKGKVYEVSDGKITFDDGWQGGFEGFEDFIARNQGWKNCLVPLVKRPAQVGEWVLIVNAICTQGDYENGDVLQIVESHADSMRFPHYKDHFAKWLHHDEYLVLDGYQPEEGGR